MHYDLNQMIVELEIVAIILAVGFGMLLFSFILSPLPSKSKGSHPLSFSIQSFRYEIIFPIF